MFFLERILGLVVGELQPWRRLTTQQLVRLQQYNLCSFKAEVRPS